MKGKAKSRRIWTYHHALLQSYLFQQVPVATASYDTLPVELNGIFEAQT